MFFSPATALTIIPPSDVCDAIDLWRRKFDPLSANIPPHITLTYPPFIAPESWPVFSLELAECLAGFASFEVLLDGAGTFPGIPLALWLRPQDDGSLARLRAELQKCFPQHVAPLPFTFIPHLTVGVFDEAESLNAARAALESGWQPQRFLVDRVFFAVQQPGGRWQIRDFLRL
jgi:2'-5' RNA ligase